MGRQTTEASRVLAEFHEQNHKAMEGTLTILDPDVSRYISFTASMGEQEAWHIEQILLARL